MTTGGVVGTGTGAMNPAVVNEALMPLCWVQRKPYTPGSVTRYAGPS